MVRQTIRKLVEQMPEHGLALHSTSSERISAIREKGLHQQRGIWFAPIPRSLALEKNVREAYERARKSAREASIYGLAAASQRAEYPAMVILKGSEQIPFTDRYYHPGAIPKEQIAKVVEITPEEYEEVTKRQEKMRKERSSRRVLPSVQRLLMYKTLAAVREIIEAEARKKKS